MSLMLRKEFYMLNKSSCMWNCTIDLFLVEKCVMKKSDYDHCIYTHYKDYQLELSIMIYFDDIRFM